jgi:hypothetical protein
VTILSAAPNHNYVLSGQECIPSQNGTTLALSLLTSRLCMGPVYPLPHRHDHRPCGASYRMPCTHPLILQRCFNREKPPHYLEVLTDLIAYAVMIVAWTCSYFAVTEQSEDLQVNGRRSLLLTHQIVWAYLSTPVVVLVLVLQKLTRWGLQWYKNRRVSRSMFCNIAPCSHLRHEPAPPPHRHVCDVRSSSVYLSLHPLCSCG